MNYRPPEILLTTKYSHYSTAVDVWSMGVVFLNLLNGGWVIAGKKEDEILRHIVHLLGTRIKTTHSYLITSERKGFRILEKFTRVQELFQRK